MLAPFRQLPRPARWYLSAHAFSVTGAGAAGVVFALAILDWYQAPWLLAAFAVGRCVALLGMWPFAGWLAERWGAARTAVVTQACFTAAYLALAWMLVHRSPGWALIAVNVAVGLVSAVDGPARRAAVADLAGPDHLVAVASLSGSAVWVGRFVGAAVGALAWQVAPIAALVGNAVSYVAVIGILWSHRNVSRARKGEVRPVPWRSLAKARDAPPLLSLLASMTVAGCGLELGVLVPLAALRVGGGLWVAAGEAAVAVAAVAAGLVVSRHAAPSARSTTAAWATVAAGGVVLTVPHPAAFLLGLAAVGAGMVAAGSLVSSAVLLWAPEGTRGDLLATSSVAQFATSLVAAPALVAAAAVAAGPALVVVCAAAGATAVSGYAHRGELPTVSSEHGVAER